MPEAGQTLAYDPALARSQPGDAAAEASINTALRGIAETTWEDYGHPARSVHAKSHALLQGTMEVLDGLPPELAQGLFARPGRYPVVMRLSTNPGDILDDTVSAPRGLAVKVIGVEGERLPGSEDDATQDFVMANAPAFVAPDAAGFARSLGLLAATTDTGQGWKKAFSALARGLVAAGKPLGLQGGPLKALGGQPFTHPLGETFYTQTPYRYGEHVAKIAVAPSGHELTALTDAPVSLAGRPNGLREEVIRFFAAHDGVWELRVQLRTDAARMPIEDSSVPWPEDASPYRTVARITAPRQPAWSEARAEAVDDRLAFSPWHGIEAHRPLGSLNRVRQSAYRQSAEFRAAHNRCPVAEPRDAVTLPGEKACPFGLAPGREGRRPGTPDARPGNFGQPMNATARRIGGGVIGGVVAGTLLSALFLGMEAALGAPSELVALKRRSAGRRLPPSVARPGLGEQAAAHGGHLALSAVSGAVYGAAAPEDASPLVAGTLFGAGFYALAYGLVGPALRVTPRLTREAPASIVRHGLFHVLFGVTTALVARRVEKRL